MKTFKNLKAGVLETVNDKLAKQYEKRPELYELVVEKKAKTTKKENEEENN